MSHVFQPTIPVFIGYDGKESAAYHVLAHSIMRRSSMPVSITPIRKSNFPPGVYNREVDARASTEFSLTRFLTPYLLDYKGWGIFMDCDMLFQDDIAKLFRLRDDDYDVMCCKHDYQPTTETKMLGARQHSYPKKNWSSVMMFNAAKCQILTPYYVNRASPAELHQMFWAHGAKAIGDLPLKWNWLVGEYGHHEKPSNLHWTLGGPWWHAYADTPYADVWREELRSMLNENGDEFTSAAVLMHTAQKHRDAAMERQAASA